MLQVDTKLIYFNFKYILLPKSPPLTENNLGQRFAGGKGIVEKLSALD